MGSISGLLFGLIGIALGLKFIEGGMLKTESRLKRYYFNIPGVESFKTNSVQTFMAEPFELFKRFIWYVLIVCLSFRISTGKEGEWMAFLSLGCVILLPSLIYRLAHVRDRIEISPKHILFRLFTKHREIDLTTVRKIELILSYYRRSVTPYFNFHIGDEVRTVKLPSVFFQLQSRRALVLLKILHPECEVVLTWKNYFSEVAEIKPVDAESIRISY